MQMTAAAKAETMLKAARQAERSLFVKTFGQDNPAYEAALRNLELAEAAYARFAARSAK